MGISGLLPMLKSIQVTTHLSTYAGETLAVDAYVWLHRGVYACATDLATGKTTTKYVDYAMQRIRLLRHHKITPYVVFDGGPLPAKQHTENDRKQRREENLAKAKALTAQGKHTQAREFYLKCVDVTPQMAYQFIKALQAENVSYTVAPYEADAQMAYLEKIGLVDGIITEDSDLLVFGCRKVLFKLDFAASTVVRISRSEFGSVTGTDGGISLTSWTDTQFRAMAILSGCDYLPNIPGVGLKTAWSLLRKHRSAEQVVRALRLEGKKAVPTNYLEAFRLAEKVFLHQRVYCPLDEKLVNLMEIPAQQGLDANLEAYIGRDIEPSLAKEVAQGIVDPITHLPMIDINPNSGSRAQKALPLHFNEVFRSRHNAEKGKGKAKVGSGGTLLDSFFSSPNITSKLTRSNSAPTKRVTAVAGKSSGKRTLGDALDDDVAAKRSKRESDAGNGGAQTPEDTMGPWSAGRQACVSSRYFSGFSPSRATRQGEDRACGLGVLMQHAKENIDPRGYTEDQADDKPDLVDQEDGYVSPSPSYFRSATPDLSSPVRPSCEESRGSCVDFGVDIIPSPGAKTGVRRSGAPADSPSRKRLEQALGTPSPRRSDRINGPDLGSILGIASEVDSEVVPSTSGDGAENSLMAATYSSVDVTLIEGDFENEARAGGPHVKVVANGWWNRWAMNEGSRVGNEAATTPDGRRRTAGAMARTRSGVDGGGSGRKTLKFFEQKRSMS